MRSTCSWILLSTLTLGLAIAGCEAENDVAPAPATADISEELFLAEAPAGAKEVGEVKAGAAVGDTVTLRGRIGGRMEPFVDGRAAFMIVGAGPLACSDMEDDHCKTPWDYCCEPQEEIAKNAATIQVVDDSGRPLKANLRGEHGLTELSEVIVVGKVAQAEGDVFVVNATGMHVVRQ